MRLPDNLLELLISEDAFRVARLMPTNAFVRFCRERGLRISQERLRQFERIDVFRPLLRAYQPDVIIKVEAVENGYRDLGELKEGENWEGQTRTDMVRFTPESRYARYWADEGLLWVPGQGEWTHASTIDSEPERHEAYYSPFMVWPLQRLLVSALTLSVELEWAVNADGTPKPEWGRRLRNNSSEYTERTVRSLRGVVPDYVTAVFCQFMANRFYYKTQSDGRRVIIGEFQDWNWRDYARQWSPDLLVNLFELSEQESRSTYELLDIGWHHLDPLAWWFPLSQFVRVDKRKRLKGDALCALTIREMAHMWRLCHAEAFGTQLCPLGEAGVQVIRRVPDVDPETDPLRALELTANDFGVNGKPQLVLFVEGDTERAIIPSMFEQLWGAPAARYGIEIFNVRGVGNATGDKMARYSALWLLVDYLHHHQTIAFVLLDNEGLARRNIKSGLASAPSVSSELRKATRANYVKLWNHSFEFDNFSNSEIATALNKLAGQRLFRQSDLVAIRNMPIGHKGPRPSLERLYQERTGHGLTKVELGRALADIMFDARSRRAVVNRPIAKLLRRVGEAAAVNHQPNTEEIWEANQRSGYLGTLVPAARRQRRRERQRRPLRSAGRRQ